jgi:transglutaminase-like putative cysteine protease
MAHEDDTTTARGRLPLLAALLAFTIATAVAFGRVYQGPGSTLKLVAAAAGAVLVAAALERLPVLVSTAGSASGLLLALALLVFPETTAYGLPTGATLRAIAAAFREVGGVASQTIAPVGPVPALLLAGVVAVWTASFAAHALVARAASGVLALLPAGALVGFADVVLEDGVRPAYMVLFLLAAFAMLSTLGLRSVARWGQLIPWSRAPRWSLFSTNALRAARRAAVPAALSAVLLPWVLPGLEARAWYPIGPAGANAPISIDPIVDLRPSLTLDPPRELFSVATPRPAYWRMVALDRFDGQRWFSSDPRGEGGSPVPDDGTLVPSAHPGIRGTTLPVSIEIGALSSLWLPVPYETAFVDPGPSEVRYDPVMGNLVVPELTDDDMEYSARGALISPQPSQIDLDFSADGLDEFYTPGNPFLELPPGLPPRIAVITQELTADWDTSYRKALAIQNYLQRFTYNENAPAGHGANHLLNFLTETKTGYCEQFAGAMAVMLRTIGIPSRVVIGFTPGAFDPDDRRYHVSTRNAHAWVEVHMGDFGWLAFEPTPSRSNPTAGEYQFPVVLPGNDLPPFAPPREDPRTEGREGDQRGEQADQGGLGPDVLPDTPERGSTAARSVLAGAALVLALLAAIPLAKLTTRRRLLAAAQGPSARTLAAYSVFERRLADLGFARRGSETLWEFRDRLRRDLTFGEGGLERLTRLAGRAAYGGGVSETEADDAVATAAAAGSDAERSVGRARRLLAIWRVTTRFGRRPPGRIARRRDGAVAWTPAVLP